MPGCSQARSSVHWGRWFEGSEKFEETWRVGKFVRGEEFEEGCGGALSAVDVSMDSIENIRSAGYTIVDERVWIIPKKMSIRRTCKMAILYQLTFAACAMPAGIMEDQTQTFCK